MLLRPSVVTKLWILKTEGNRLIPGQPFVRGKWSPLGIGLGMLLILNWLSVGR